MPKIFLWFLLREFETIPTDEPNSTTFSHDGKSFNLDFNND